MVVEVRGDKVRLGITAPRSMTILRSEIPDRNDPAALKGNES
jgi:carbon storage regulator CsrA